MKYVLKDAVEAGWLKAFYLRNFHGPEGATKLLIVCCCAGIVLIALVCCICILRGRCIRAQQLKELENRRRKKPPPKLVEVEMEWADASRSGNADGESAAEVPNVLQVSAQSQDDFYDEIQGPEQAFEGHKLQGLAGVRQALDDRLDAEQMSGHLQSANQSYRNHTAIDETVEVINGADSAASFSEYPGTQQHSRRQSGGDMR